MDRESQAVAQTSAAARERVPGIIAGTVRHAGEARAQPDMPVTFERGFGPVRHIRTARPVARHTDIPGSRPAGDYERVIRPTYTWATDFKPSGGAVQGDPELSYRSPILPEGLRTSPQKLPPPKAIMPAPRPVLPAMSGAHSVGAIAAKPPGVGHIKASIDPASVTLEPSGAHTTGGIARSPRTPVRVTTALPPSPVRPKVEPLEFVSPRPTRRKIAKIPQPVLPTGGEGAAGGARRSQFKCCKRSGLE